MLFCIDLDGTADAYPREFQAMMCALRSAGHQVHVVTGVSTPTPTQVDVDAKTDYLCSLGLGECYDQLAVIAGPENMVAERKVRYLKAHQADVLFDNSEANCQAATSSGFLSLLPWGTRE